MLVRLPALVAGLFAAGAAVAAPAALTDAAVRDFVQRQERAWNGRDLGGFFATFVPAAVFVDRARTPDGGTIRYGSSTLAQARLQSAHYFAGAGSVDRTTIERIEIAADGRSARVVGHKVSQMTRNGHARTLCAQTEQTLALAAGGVRSHGQTDTATRCPH